MAERRRSKAVSTSEAMVGPVISVSSSAGWLGRGREKVVCKRASAAVERTASATL